MMSRSVFRIRLITAGIFLFAVLLCSKLYMIQIVQGSTYSEKADKQYVRPDVYAFNRGSIYFKDKNDELISGATLRSGYNVAINPKILTSPELAFKQLSEITPIDKTDFLTRANKQDDPFEEVAKRVSEDEATQIVNLGIKGVNVYKEKWRFYPGSTMAAHTLGFVGFKGNTLAGRYGLERSYDDMLNRSASSVYVNFFAEAFANLNNALTKKEDHLEADLVTTIEPTVQAYLESVLKKVADEWHSFSTGGIVINPANGEVYAIGALETFDPNKYFETADVAIYANPLIENVYEMGSIIKALTMSAGLNEGVVDAQSTYYDAGQVTLNNAVIKNYDGEGRGTVNMQTVLNKSLNTGVVHVVRKLGNKKFAEYMEGFGLRELTNIDLPNEALSITNNLDSPRDVEYATASFGQGIALSPIATVRALSAIANGGKLIIPHVGKRLLFTSGIKQDILYKEKPSSITNKTSEEITRMLVKVVDEALVNGEVKLDNFSIAAKTGTAQIANTDDGGYYEDKFFHSFFGYFPAYEPKFLVFLYTDRPKNVRYASQTLTDPFMDITKFLLNYYEIPPDR